MGYTTKTHRFGRYQAFWPDDTDHTFYVQEGVMSLAELLEKVKEKWPDVSLDKIDIDAEHIQTDHIGYDLYDASDYTNFIVVRR